MNRTRCLLTGAALLAVGMLPSTANAEVKTKASTRVEPRIDLGGISLGDPVTLKDAANFLRKGKKLPRTLFGVLGTPAAVVVPATSALHKETAARRNGIKSENKTVQTPPDWIKGVVYTVPDNHVLWLYRRSGYAMSFLVNRQGTIDAITIARTRGS